MSFYTAAGDPFAHLGQPRTRAWLEQHHVVWDESTDILPSVILGVYRRMSTLGQATGYRQQSMIEDMTEVVLSKGPAFGVIVFDEGNRSGTDLSKRKVAVAMISALEEGDIDGIATPDAKRLSRDQYQGGGREIIRALRKRKGMLMLGRGDVVNLRSHRDRKSFERELREASDEIGEIKYTMYSGQASRYRQIAEGKVEPMFKGPAPYGYHHVDCLDEHQEVVRSRGVARRTLAKYVVDAQGMARMIELFGSERSLNAVARILNQEGHGRRVHKGAHSKGWTGQRVRGLLNNPVYYGVWHAVRTKKSDLWDDFEEADLSYPVPELAYWTEPQARAWLDKFGQPIQTRQRTYERPFVNLLVCTGCNEPMVSAGRHGYRCRSDGPQRQGLVAGACAAPQVLSAEQAKRLLREAWVANIGGLAHGIAEQHEQQKRAAAADPETEQLAQLDAEEANLLDLTAGRAPSAQMRQRFAAIEARREALEDQQRQRAQIVRLSDDDVAWIQAVSETPAEVYDLLEPGQQAEAWRLLGVKVRIERVGGRGWNTRYEVGLVGQSLSGSNIWILRSYLSQVA